jgi:hypothetical protein
MLTVYAQFLITDLMDDSSIDGTTLLAAMSMDGTSAAGAPCPYSHSKDRPTPPITVTKFQTIVISDDLQQALLARHVRPPAHTAGANTVWAVANSGASHKLVRESDSHILCDHEFSGQQAPFAVLKTANGGPLAAIGRGTLPVGSLHLPAYIFRSDDLINNLLGLTPFFDRNCTSIFKPTSFHMHHGENTAPIMVGRRDSARSLWLVQLGITPHVHPSDGIPPPQHTAYRNRLHPATPNGTYIEANHVERHDNASYVCALHPRLPRIPCPNQFLAGSGGGIHHGPQPVPATNSQDGPETPAQRHSHREGSLE